MPITAVPHKQNSDMKSIWFVRWELLLDSCKWGNFLFHQLSPKFNLIHSWGPWFAMMASQYHCPWITKKHEQKMLWIKQYKRMYIRSTYFWSTLRYLSTCFVSNPTSSNLTLGNCCSMFEQNKKYESVEQALNF